MAFGMQSPDKVNVRLAQFCAAMILTCLMSASPLGFHIENVVSLRSKKEMIDRNAQAVIALVANLLSAWVAAGEEKPGGTMRQHLAAL